MTDLAFEAIADKHYLVNFASGVDSLDHWLQSEALAAHRGGLSSTHVSVDPNDEYFEVKGFFTLCPTLVTDRPEGGAARGGGYPSYLLCKLARHEDLKATNHGGDLLAEALAKTVEAADAAGGVFLVVDPRVDEADEEQTEIVRNFYSKNGFRDWDDGQNRMWISIQTIRKRMRAVGG